MKKTYILILGAIISLTSCGMIAKSTSSNDGARFLDGIYDSSPTFISKSEKAKEKAKRDSLVALTKESTIYLYGEKKDTIMIPENFMASIKYDQKVGHTVVTVAENPYSWIWNPEFYYGYHYGPYSLGSSWYWSRYYYPYYSAYYNPFYNPWGYSSWHYYSFYDPWYYGGYWGNYWGNYWGWHDPWHHYHHHCGWYQPPYYHSGPSHIAGGTTGGHSNRYYGRRARTESYGSLSGNSSASKPSKTARPSTGTSRGGMSVGNRTSRTNATSGRGSSSPTYRRPTNSNSSSTGSSSSSSSSSSYSRGSSSSYGTYNRSASSPSGSYSRGSGNSSGSSSYNRGGSAGGYRR